MSDPIKHECGIALLRLLKPLEYYISKYGTSLYGLNKLYLLMEKQHNRGQDGAGVAVVKYDLPPGHKYINIQRSIADSPIKDVFNHIYKNVEKNSINPKQLDDPLWMKTNIDFAGELYLGHLRYGTFGKNSIDSCHPFMIENNWMTKTLLIAGNFNMTNVEELLHRLIELGQHPKETSDTITILEKIGHFLNDENQKLFEKYKSKGNNNREITDLISTNISIQHVLQRSCKYWDGGYVIAGLLGHGDSFVLRDPAGIRPAYYYADDEVVVVTSERPPIQAAFNTSFSDIKEVQPGHALIIRKSGKVSEVLCKQPTEKKACSFERIYFSRGNDKEIYSERKNLGKSLSKSILKAVDFDIKHSVVSYIPNTASAAFYGLVEELNVYCDKIKKEKILQLSHPINSNELNEILSIRPRMEKIAVKDVKLRTFITDDNQRNDLVNHVYDITYDTVRKKVDNLIVIDDSIVRGTTLKQSIISILSRLEPKKIIIASSAPQIRYPDCYGIDMAKLFDFIAFKAAIELLKETKQDHIISEVYKLCLAQQKLPKEEVVNHVKKIYEPLSTKQITNKISQLVTPANLNCEVQIIYQTIEDLHKACPNHKGDWYFTGNYPTPGGNKVVNKSFINFIEERNVRAYN